MDSEHKKLYIVLLLWLLQTLVFLMAVPEGSLARYLQTAALWVGVAVIWLVD